jgi:hypothetical protein
MNRVTLLLATSLFLSLASHASANEDPSDKSGPRLPPLVALKPDHQNLLPLGPPHALNASEISAYRKLWTNLASTDTPPYPEKGFGELIEVIRQYAMDVDAKETLILRAELNSNGQVTDVRSIRYQDDQLLKRAVWGVVDTHFVPALCAGVPCRSTVPIVVRVPR